MSDPISASQVGVEQGRERGSRWFSLLVAHENLRKVEEAALQDPNRYGREEVIVNKSTLCIVARESSL